MEKVDQASLSGTIGWLENEYREQQVAISRLQQQLEQVNNAVHQQTLDIRLLEDSITSLRNQVLRLPKIDEALNQVSHLINQIQNALAEQSQRSEKFERQYQVDVERLRQGAAELWQRTELIEKETEPLGVRLLTLGDTQKRQQESLIGQQAAIEKLDRQLGAVSNRLELQGEQNRRTEQGIGRFDSEIEALRKQDELLAHRIQGVADLAKRIDEQMAAVLAEERLRRDLAERVEVQRVQHQRTQDALVEVQQSDQQQARQLEGLVKSLRELDERGKAVSDRVNALREQLIQVRSEFASHLAELQFLLDQQKRRQVAQVQQELKELAEFKIEPLERKDG